MKNFPSLLAALEADDARRSLRSPFSTAGAVVEQDGRRIVNLASNDYLGLAADPRLAEAAAAAARAHGSGATASRLVSGNLSLDDELETTLADHYGREAALVFPTGYMANVGLCQALFGKGDAVYADRLNHASLVDGIRLSGALLVRYRHRDLAHLGSLLAASKAAHRYVVTDSVFSMDGDRADLAGFSGLCRRHGAFLIVDEAHANGVLGRNGLGLAEEQGVSEKVDLVMGTFSKALGSLGGYVIGDRAVIDWIINKGRAFVYTTGLPPAVLAANAAALAIVRAEPERRRLLLARAGRMRAALAGMGFSCGDSTTQIIPLVVGENAAALALSEALLAKGFLVPAIRPPTVPPGTARLRISLSAAHAEEDLAAFLDALGAVAGSC